MNLLGFHHLTAVTANASKNHDFYTRVLGMRLVKKTVNQDDTSAYHLFYGDGVATPGTDITFFEWPTLPAKRGTNSVVRTGFRVLSSTSLAYWKDRFSELNVRQAEIQTRDGREVLDFEDHEGQRMSLIVDPAGGPVGGTWERSTVPAEHQLRSLASITISVSKRVATEATLISAMNMKRVREYTAPRSDGGAGDSTYYVYQMTTDATGSSAELHVAVEPDMPRAHPGSGGVHHVAFRTPNPEEYAAWNERLHELRIPSSGPVNRFYFQSLYFREPNGVLFEIATDGPGFDADEPLETLGEGLSLPPFLEGQRAKIEAGLQPIEARDASAK